MNLNLTRVVLTAFFASLLLLNSGCLPLPHTVMKNTSDEHDFTDYNCEGDGLTKLVSIRKDETTGGYFVFPKGSSYFASSNEIFLRSGINYERTPHLTDPNAYNLMVSNWYGYSFSSESGHQLNCKYN